MAENLTNLFGNINDPNVQKIMRSLNMIQDVEVKAGEYIFHEGDQSADFYIIGLGAVEVLKMLDPETKKQKILDNLGSGDFFGEGAIFTDTPRSASVRALSDCRLFKIDKGQFFELLKSNNDIAVVFLSNMLSVVNKRLHHSNRELVVLYEVSRLIAEEVNGFEEMASGILEQLVDITANEKAVFLVVDQVAKKERVVAEHGFDTKDVKLSELVPTYDEIVADLKADKVHSKIVGHHLFLGIKDLKGELNGVIVLFDKEGEFNDDDVRLCVSVAEQLGHVIENFAGKEAEQGREKLGKEFLSF